MTEEETILLYLPRVRQLACWRSNRNPALAEDLEGSGVIGLYQAMASYNPNRGVQFWTWAHDHLWSRSNGSPPLPS